jgi:hypothetical protein
MVFISLRSGGGLHETPCSHDRCIVPAGGAVPGGQQRGRRPGESVQDAVYGQSGAKALAISNPEQAVMNADNHEYFAENTPALP